MGIFEKDRLSDDVRGFVDFYMSVFPDDGKSPYAYETVDRQLISFDDLTKPLSSSGFEPGKVMICEVLSWGGNDGHWIWDKPQLESSWVGVIHSYSTKLSNGRKYSLNSYLPDRYKPTAALNALYAIVLRWGSGQVGHYENTSTGGYRREVQVYLINRKTMQTVIKKVATGAMPPQLISRTSSLAVMGHNPSKKDMEAIFQEVFKKIDKLERAG